MQGSSKTPTDPDLLKTRRPACRRSSGPIRVNEIESRSVYPQCMVDFAGMPETVADGVRAEAQPLALSKRRALVWLALAALVLLAILARLIPILFVPSVNWADEIFQTIEPAHRLMYGYGMVPWEFQLGMRSWLLPGLIAGLIEFARLLGEGPDYYLPVIAVAFALLASAPVICCFLWCRRWYGSTVALVGAAAVALAPEAVYFGARTLSEVVAAHILVIGCYLLAPGRHVGSRERLFVAGVIFGLVCLLRIQLAPAIGVVVLWVSWRDWRAHFPALIAGGAAVLVVGGILDWVTLGYPLASVWRNVLYNLIYGVSSDFGTEPWYHYLFGELGVWNVGVPLLVLLVVLGARRMPSLLVGVIGIAVIHSLISHKEYRFIYPALVMTMALAGLGLAQLIDLGTQWLVDRQIRRTVAAAACASVVLCCWGFTTFGVWTGKTLTILRQLDHNNILALRFVRQFPSSPCGIGLYGENGKDWGWYGGYSYLHRRDPDVLAEGRSRIRPDRVGFR